MAISLSEQYSQALGQTDFRARVAAALMNAAITALSAPVGTPPTAAQVKRLKFAAAVIADVNTHLTAVSWVVITRPTLASLDDLKVDANITTILNQNTFDLIAAQLIPDPAA